MLITLVWSAIAYEQQQDSAVDEEKLIYAVIEELEHDIRYRYAKNFRAYNDVLAIVLIDHGYDDEAERLVPFHLFLESGGSSPVYLALISLGLSRSSALLLRRKIRFPSNATPEYCLRTLKRVSPRLLAVGLPKFCYREVALITGG